MGKAQQAWWDRNKDRICAERRKRYRQDSVFREETLAKQAVRRAQPGFKKAFNTYKKDWRARNPEKQHRSWLVTEYGKAAPDIYARLLKEQNGRCAFCFKEPNGKSKLEKRLHLDHDHRSEQLRRLLCLQCNAAYGYAKENAATLHRMLKAAIQDARERNNLGLVQKT